MSYESDNGLINRAEIEPPAFELIRKHKQCSIDTQRIVLKKNAGRLTPIEMYEAFENGIAGKYGKFDKADPQTLINWNDHFLRDKASPKNYLDKSLLPPNVSMRDDRYPFAMREWYEEANRCYNAFLNGVACDKFHPHIYDRMLLDNKIDLDSCKQFFTEVITIKNCNDAPILEMIDRAKQKVLCKVFESYRDRGFTFVYPMKKKEDER